jgi:hypothetical protein
VVMATTQSMIQFEVTQFLDSLVSDVSGIDDMAFIFLDPNKKTILRELTAEEVGGIMVSKAPGLAPIGMNNPFVKLSFFFQRRDDQLDFYGPSHVPSPEMKGSIGAILRVLEVGVSVGSPGQLSVSRRIGAHAYIDQVD